MKQLVEYIVSNLVNHPEDVSVEEQATEDDLTLINIKVNPEDIGRVIGKSGKVIKAIRQITRIAAIQKGIRVRVDLIDSDSPQQEETPPESTPEAETEETQEDNSSEDNTKQVYPEPETSEQESQE